MTSIKTLDCLCCGKVYPLKYIYVSSAIPAICEDCVLKIKDAYECYLKDHALDELECLLKFYNSPTDYKLTLASMRSIYKQKVSPLLDVSELTIEVERFNSFEINDCINGLKKVQKAREKDLLVNLEDLSEADVHNVVKCSASDYQKIAMEAARLKMKRKNRNIRTAISMAWQEYVATIIKEIKSDSPYILIEQPDFYIMSIVVDDILSRKKANVLGENPT